MSTSRSTSAAAAIRAASPAAVWNGSSVVSAAQNASCRRKRAPATNAGVSSSADVSVQYASSPFTFSADRRDRVLRLDARLDSERSGLERAVELVDGREHARDLRERRPEQALRRAPPRSCRRGGPAPRARASRARVPAAAAIPATWSRCQCESAMLRCRTPSSSSGSRDQPAHARARVEQEHVVALAEVDAGGLAAVGRDPAAAAEQLDVQISTSGAGVASASPVFGVPSRSISRTCASGSARGQCSTPAGTT